MLENSEGITSDNILKSLHNDIDDNKENRGCSEIAEEKSVQCKTKRVLTLVSNAKPSDTGKTKTWAEAPERTDSPTGQIGPDNNDDTPRTPTRMLMVHDTRMLHDHDSSTLHVQEASTLHVQEAAMLHVQEAATPERPGRPSVPTPGKYGTGYVMMMIIIIVIMIMMMIMMIGTGAPPRPAPPPAPPSCPRASFLQLLPQPRNCPKTQARE